MDTAFETGRFDPFGADYLADPYPQLAEAREAAPAFYSPALDHWVVTRYDDIRNIFLAPAVFSAANALAPFTPPCPAAARKLADVGLLPTLADADPPAHTRVRRMANSAFTPRRVATMEPVVRAVVARFCDERLRLGHADIIRDFAWDLPVIVLFSILGAPVEDVAQVKEATLSRVLITYGKPSAEDQVRAADGLVAFWHYAQALVEDRIRDPRDDFTTDLVQARDADGDGLTAAEASTVTLNLLVAGHETTTSLLGNAFRRLLEDGDAWDQLCADPTLIPGAVEEVLRLDAPIIAWRRRTTQPVDIGGVTVPQGANLLLMLGSANRDPAKFPQPDAFDVRRPNARQHLSFGFGAHVCLGAPLARLEARIVLEEVSARLPSLRLAAGQPLEFLPNISFRGPLSLPVEWDT
ncbi:MAG TPA: cytochrome P450 [Acidimicrobiales bacterium]|nr:cytochrome P450 [Acidimicrobiales bacterium]